jgi:hypothetical protein
MVISEMNDGNSLKYNQSTLISWRENRSNKLRTFYSGTSASSSCRSPAHSFTNTWPLLHADRQNPNPIYPRMSTEEEQAVVSPCQTGECIVKRLYPSSGRPRVTQTSCICCNIKLGIPGHALRPESLRKTSQKTFPSIEVWKLLCVSQTISPREMGRCASYPSRIA